MYSTRDVADSWINWVENISNDDVRNKEIYPYLCKWIIKYSPKSILEIGSGQGVCSEKVNLNNAQYIGVEPSSHLRGRAIQLYPDKKFIAGRAEDLPVGAETIDAVFSVFVWFHIKELNQAASELSRVLVSNGRFVIITANPDSYDLWKSWHKNIKIDGKELRGDMERLPGDIIYLYSLEEIEKSFNDNNLKVAEVLQCGYENEDKIPPGFAIIISGFKV